MKKTITMTCAALAFFGGSLAFADDIPPRPADIKFEPLEFTPPSPSAFRHELSNGIPVYMAPSHEFPLVTITFSFKGGAYMEPADEAGLAAMTGAMMRTGGSKTMSPSELDEAFDFLAADASAGVGDRSSNASINALTSNLDEAFGLFMDMVKNPRFDEKRLEVLKGQSLEGLKARDDNGLGIAVREMGFLMWGQDSFEARQPTKASIEGITVEDMRRFHDMVFNPANLMIAVTGDFETDEMQSFLENALKGWDWGQEAPDVPTPEHTFEPGVYYYEKDQNQVQVFIGHRGIERDNPDAIAVDVMNDILGGSGFTSRITNSVRTREGLAYTAGSVLQPRVGYPGIFMSYFFTKVPTTALATRLVFDEIEKMQTEEPTAEELKTIKSNTIETFPRRFESKDAMLRLFISDERTGRAPDYWQKYRDRVSKVSAKEVLKMAKEYLHPKDAIILVVGPWEQIKKGNADSEADKNRVATMGEFFDGKAHEIPTRDPETLEPVK